MNRFRLLRGSKASVSLLLCAVAIALFGSTIQSEKEGGTVPVQVEQTANKELAFHYTLPFDGFVTLVVDDIHGVRIRNLIGAVPRKAGENSELWDGTDDEGHPVTSSRYRCRLLYHRGINAEYVMSYGNPGTPPWATADGTGGWGADHTKPQAAVTTPDGVVLGWPTAEAGWFLIGVDGDGHKKWGLKNRYAFGDTIVNLATDGDYLYVASEQNPAPLMKYYKKLAHGVLFRYRLSDRKTAKIGDADEVVVTDTMDGNVRGLALEGNTAYVALEKENKIATISLIDGKPTPEKDISIPAPAGMSADQNGDLIVISGNQLKRIDPKTRQSRSLVSEGLQDPAALFVDKAGTIYLSDRGKAQQVKVFSSHGGLLRTIGIPGGRSPRGPHQSTGMYQPRGLTVDAKGLLWVMEEDDKPKRVSVWNATTGSFVREYIGPPRYGALAGAVSPFDRTVAFGEGVQYRLDWQNKNFAFIATTGRESSDEDVFGRAPIRQIFQHDGRILTSSNSHVQVIGELKGGTLHPLAAVGEIDELTRREGMYTGSIARKTDQLRAMGSKVDAKGNPIPATAFIWTDQNGDGIAQDSEFTWKPNLHWGGYWGTGMGKDLSIYMQSSGKVYSLPVTGWNAYGGPVYKFESATTIAYNGAAEHVTATPDGMLIVNAKPELQGIDLASGQRRWTYPNPWEGVQGSHVADVPAPGRLIGPLYTTGFAEVGGQGGTLFAMNGNLGQQFLMTTDGLWVAALLRDWRLAKVEDMYTIPDEDFGGYFWRDQTSGEVYLEAGKTEYRLYRVTGLDTIRRGQADFLVSGELANAFASSLSQQKPPREFTPTAVITKLGSPLKISGKLEDVPKSMKFTEVAADSSSKFRFAFGHDQQNLYVVYEVTDDTPLENKGQDFKQMFNTGDCVDLMYGTNPKADPRRKEGAEGDNRLLLTVRDGKPLVVLYKQTDPTRHWPVAFMSPSRAVYFGAVIELQDADIAVSRSNNGYILTASIPLSTLGINPSAASSFLVGDVGVIYGSQSGNGARLRLYWANKETAITSDVPSEAALVPANWGRFRFEY